MNKTDSEIEKDQNEEGFDNPCPECQTQLTALWSGVKCPNPKCDYWFCF